MDDPVLSEQLQIIMYLPDITVKFVGEAPDTLWGFVHYMSQQLQAAGSQQCPQIRRVLEVPHVRRLFTILKAFSVLYCSTAILLSRH